MPGGFWHTLRASLALAALIAVALISADKLDRQRAESRTALVAEPVATGSLGQR